MSDVTSSELPLSNPPLSNPPPGAPSTPGDMERSRAKSHVADLIDLIKESAEKLRSDEPRRGDLKILSRSLRELRYAFKVFAPYRDRYKVAIFGSARTRPDHANYQQAMEFGRQMAERQWLVITGAASGIMEAGHRGAGREASMGLNIMLPFEQEANPVIAGDPKLVHMKYFFTRKLMFVKESHAVCCLPGGFGTLDEALEVLTLLQTGKRDLVPVVLLDHPGGHYWRTFHEFVIKDLLGRGMISVEDLTLYKLTDDVSAAVEHILEFYRVYHSMRYVRNRLVLRVREAPAAELLAAINEAFADICVEGEIALSPPLPEERDEPDLAALPRLVLRFNRRNLGRLRQLVDCLNRGAVGPEHRLPLPLPGVGG